MCIMLRLQSTFLTKIQFFHLMVSLRLNVANSMQRLFYYICFPPSGFFTTNKFHNIRKKKKEKKNTSKKGSPPWYIKIIVGIFAVTAFIIALVLGLLTYFKFSNKRIGIVVMEALGPKLSSFNLRKFKR